jgi:hypothetical protein
MKEAVVKIPVFVSCPTALNAEQDACRQLILDELDDLQLQPRAIGRYDYPTDLPLREVLVLASHCSGGVILGFEQVFVESGIVKPGTESETIVQPSSPVRLPSPWNQIEAGILHALGRPIIVFREQGVGGGVLDEGVTDVFVHKMPKPPMTENNADALTAVFLKWQARVRSHYYGD